MASGFNFHTSTGILGGGREGGKEGRRDCTLFEMALTNWNSVIVMVT